MAKKIFSSRMIITIELIFLAGALAYLFFSTTPKQVYPTAGMVIISPNFDFEVQNSNEIVISTSKNFENPIVLNYKNDINLPAGTYFWKVKSKFRESEVRNFTVQGNAALNLREKNNSYELENAGNVDLNVSRNGGISGYVTLNVGESKEAEKNSTYQGGQI